MTTTYEKNGLRFLYPENWKLSDESSRSGQQVSLETPDGGIWAVTVFDAELGSQTLLEEAVAGLQDAYEEVESAPVEAAFPDVQTQAVEANFYCLDFVVTARIHAITTPGKRLVVLYQAESREFDKQLEVFTAMTLNLLQSST